MKKLLLVGAAALVLTAFLPDVASAQRGGGMRGGGGFGGFRGAAIGGGFRGGGGGFHGGMMGGGFRGDGNARIDQFAVRRDLDRLLARRLFVVAQKILHARALPRYGQS